MMLKSMVGFAMVFALLSAFAQDFKKSYPIIPPVDGPAKPDAPGAPAIPRMHMPGGGDIRIVIEHVSGSLKVSGYDGKTVEITAKKKGPDREKIEINDRSLGNRIDLFISAPALGLRRSQIECEVRVPKSEKFNFWLVTAGDVTVSKVGGRIWAKSDRGNVDVREIQGLVSAFSGSGNVKVELDSVEERSNMRFSSISGNVHVVVPRNFDALVEISSRSGFLKSDFPIDIREARYGPGRSGRGKLGDGRNVLFMRSEFGHVSLARK